MRKLICECCGGQINPHTMKCEYCGTQYEQKDEYIYRVETYNAPIKTFQAAYNIDEDMMRVLPPKDIAEIVTGSVARELADIIAPYCEYVTHKDIRTMGEVVRARIKIVEPINKGITVEGERL